MHAGVDHGDETELLTESPPFPVSLKSHPSNTGRQSGEASSHGLFGCHSSWDCRAEEVRQGRRTGRDQEKRKAGKTPRGPEAGPLGDQAEGGRPDPGPCRYRGITVNGKFKHLSLKSTLSTLIIHACQRSPLNNKC